MAVLKLDHETMRQLQAQISSAKIETRESDQLLPYAMNSRKHSDWQIAKIAASIKEFGFTNPVLIDENDTVVAGHARVMAALKLDLPEIPVIVLRHLTKAQRRAYVIADNALAEGSSWDDQILSSELIDLKNEAVDLSVLGLSDLRFNDLLTRQDRIGIGGGETDPDKEWTGMPEFDQRDKAAEYQVVVNFNSASDRDAFAELVGQDLSDKTRSIWFPKAEIERYMDKRYGSDSEP
jgi:hypothetical protein